MLKRILAQALLVTVVVVLTTIFQPLRLFDSLAQPAGTCQTFKETGKSVCGKFLTYWLQHGGVAQQGFPLSGEFNEISDLNGKPYTVQYFERAVFELHPENPAPFDVLLSQLGRIQLARKYPNGAPSGVLSPIDLKFQLFEVYGKDLRYCDPDYWPIARDENAAADAWLASADKASEEYTAILKYNNIAASAQLTADQKLFVYREHKRLNAVTLEKSGDSYNFVITTGGDVDKPGEPGPGTRITGIIDAKGVISKAVQTGINVGCPRCLAGGTVIDTPNGPMKVQDIKQGMAVWTTDKKGTRVAGVVLKTAQIAVPVNHQVVHLVLSDGRELYVSPGHPLVGGRAVGTLGAGQTVDGAKVVSAEWITYNQPYTYDLLPSGDTGTYWANDILIASTLK